jgi:hypothetical protein
MGFYLRKSVSVGPFRFNLSGSGIGMSVGVRGFRVGSGPRGNYVHVGRHGVYYRQTLPPIAPRQEPAQPLPVAHSGTHAPLTEIASASAGGIVDSSSEQFLNDLREKRRRLALLPFVIVGTVLTLIGVVSAGWPDWAVWLLLLVGGFAVVAALYRDKMVRTAVILYDLDAEIEAAFHAFVDWGEAIAKSRRVWHIAAAGRVYDRKYHAGASEVVRRNATVIRVAPPSFVKTNVPVLRIGTGRQTLYFLPDRLLVEEGSTLGAVSYGSLNLSVHKQQFIEDGGVPSDASVVGRTWRYVNRNGGPDRRFNNNPQLPICLYDELHFHTPSGLQEIVQLSRPNVAEGFAVAVQRLAAVVR